MPIPLAHPAAVLPLHRFTPNRLDLSALIIGSLVPDLAAGIDDWEYFSHSPLGSLVFCLPAGFITLWIFRWVRIPLAATLPRPHRDTLLSFCRTARNPHWGIVFSLLLGIWIHIAWDWFTHDRGWVVQGLPLNRILWTLSSVVGTGIVALVYLSMLRRGHARLWPVLRPDACAYAAWLGILSIPFAGAVPLTLHDRGVTAANMGRYLAIYYMGCAYVTLALAGIFVKLRTPKQA